MSDPYVITASEPYHALTSPLRLSVVLCRMNALSSPLQTHGYTWIRLAPNNEYHTPLYHRPVMSDPYVITASEPYHALTSPLRLSVVLCRMNALSSPLQARGYTWIRLAPNNEHHTPLYHRPVMSDPYVITASEPYHALTSPLRLSVVLCRMKSPVVLCKHVDTRGSSSK